MKLTINTDAAKNASESSGMEVGLDSIQAWIANKQISPVFMVLGERVFEVQMTDGTRLSFVSESPNGRVTVTPPSKRQ